MEALQTQETGINIVPESSPFSLQSFEHAQRIAKMIATSALIPSAYQGRVENVMIALEMAHRSGDSPLMVMQNLNVIKGKPSWGSSYIIAKINACGRFGTPLKFEKSGEGENYGYIAWLLDKKGDRLEGVKVTWAMVKAEGWLSKDGSKWKTMPELMFQYRAAAFFGRLHTPEILMGMQTAEEIIDISHTEEKQVITVEQLQALLDDKISFLNKKEFDDAKRIIAMQEASSYKKLYNFLLKKTE